MSVTQETACRTCRFWLPEKETLGKTGACRFNPPQIIVHIVKHPISQQAAQVTQPMFASTGCDDWCGQHKPKIEVN